MTLLAQLFTNQPIINRKQDIYKIPLGLIVFALMAASPLLVGFLGAWASEKLTGETCNEGNCFWMALPWCFFVSFPEGAAFSIIFLVRTVKQVWNLFKKK